MRGPPLPRGAPSLTFMFLNRWLHPSEPQSSCLKMGLPYALEVAREGLKEVCIEITRDVTLTGLHTVSQALIQHYICICSCNAPNFT